MISDRDALYRLEMASRYLAAAEKMLAAEEWPGCVHYAQLTVENAAKAVLACLGPIPRTHDIAEWLQKSLEQELPEAVSIQVRGILPIVGEYGRKKHILTTYGDEELFRTPWDLFAEEDARQAVEDARRCLGAASEVCKYYFGSGPVR